MELQTKELLLMLDKSKTCFENCRLLEMSCKNTTCRHAVINDTHFNCSLLAIKNGQGQTLADIGKVFNLTRMRICQIEKAAIKKIKED
jgi:hypothetical protein